MNPKDKAIELFNKFKLKPIKPIYFMHPQHSKQCALIAVDELIESWNKDLYENCGASEYWIEVRKEIEKL
jgi:hypothetical protein